jgi:hypothetical protein
MKSIFTKIHYPVFIISFAIGMFLVYLTKPVPKVIIKYPTPESVENLVYQDDSMVENYIIQILKKRNIPKVLAQLYIELIFLVRYLLQNLCF